MLRRFITILVLVQQAAWLLVVLPGHQRGAMSIAGTEAAQSSCHVEQKHSCCETSSTGSAATAPGTPTSGNDKSKSSDPLKKLNHCAVCHVAVRLTPAPPPDFVSSPTGLVAQLMPSGPGAIVSLTVALPYDSTGPPVAA